MDLTKFLGQDSQEQSAQRLSKEEYAAQKCRRGKKSGV